MLLVAACKECQREYSYDPRFDAFAYTQGRCRDCADRKGAHKGMLPRKSLEHSHGHNL